MRFIPPVSRFIPLVSRTVRGKFAESPRTSCDHEGENAKLADLRTLEQHRSFPTAPGYGNFLGYGNFPGYGNYPGYGS